MPVQTVFRSTGVVMVRATTAPADIDVPAQIDLADDAAVLREGWPWLVKTWARADVRDALNLASPGLATQLDRLV